MRRSAVRIWQPPCCLLGVAAAAMMVLVIVGAVQASRAVDHEAPASGIHVPS